MMIKCNRSAFLVVLVQCPICGDLDVTLQEEADWWLESFGEWNCLKCRQEVIND
jgi:hypothetical protein